MDDFIMRRGTRDDLALICRHRNQMFYDMGEDPAKVAEQAGPFVDWVIRMIDADRFIQWFIADGDEVVAGAAVWLMDWLPGPLNPRGGRVYVLNVYTEPDYRHRGLARRLMQTIIAWAREQGFEAISLHASYYGRPLYEDLGFVATNEFRLLL